MNGQGQHYLKRELYELVRKDASIFEFLQAGSLDGIWYWDIENPKEEWLSPRFKELFGYEDHEIPNTSAWWQENIFPEDRPVAIDNLNKHFADPSHPYDQVVRYRHKDGSIVWVRCRGIAIRDECGKPVRMLGAHTDITQLVQTKEALREAKEAAEAANRAKSAFLAFMSHNFLPLFTSIGPMLGYIEMLLDSQVTPQQRELLTLVEESGGRLLTIIHDIRDFSKIEAGKVEMASTVFDLQECLERLLCLLRLPIKRQSHRKHLEFACHVAPDVPDFVVGDPCRLQQVLMNLVEYGIDSTETGEVVVHVGLESASIDDIMLHFEVRNTGVGIPEGEMQAILEPYAQGAMSALPGSGETRLLMISSKLVELMGGRIWVESELGSGSTFHFTARLRVATEEERVATERSRERSSGLRPLQVLLAEDSPVNQRLAISLLERDGHTVTVASNGREAISAFESQWFDLVLMDIEMPEMDGLEAAGVIRAKKQQTDKHVPIIAMTANAMKAERERCLEAGMDDYVAKPIGAHLFDTIERALAAAPGPKEPG